MPVWTLYIGIGGLLAILGLIAFREGWVAARLTETDAITAYAARYVDEAGTGASRNDCVARPGDGVWLEIICDGIAGRYVYHVTRWGTLQRREAPDAMRPRM